MKVSTRLKISFRWRYTTAKTNKGKLLLRLYVIKTIFETIVFCIFSEIVVYFTYIRERGGYMNAWINVQTSFESREKNLYNSVVYATRVMIEFYT